MNDSTQHITQVHYDTTVPVMLYYEPDTVVTSANDSVSDIAKTLDSLFAHDDNDSVVYRKSMFTIKGTRNDRDSIQRQSEPANDWIFGVIVLLLIGMSFYINRRRVKVKDMILALFDIRVLERIVRENNIKPITLFPQGLIYMASVAFIALAAAMNSGNGIAGMTLAAQYGVTLGAITAIIMLRNGTIRLMGNIFEDRESTHLYILNSYLYYSVGSLIIPPLLLLVFYSSIAETALLRTTLIIITIIFIVRLFRGMQLILTNSKTSKMYLFYYLCILEIAPILVMAKLIIF